jgi:hypothetical protein
LSIKALVEALFQSKGISFSGQVGWLSVTFEWIEHVYCSPIDGTSYVTPSGWKRYEPESPRAHDPALAAHLIRAVLLSSEKDLASNITAEDLADLMQKIEVQVQQVCARTRSSFDLLIQCTLNALDKPTFQIAIKGQSIQVDSNQEQSEQPMIKDLYSALGNIQPLYSKRDAIAFHLYFGVSPAAIH